MRDDQALQFSNHGVVLAEREIGVDAMIQRDQPKLLEARRLGGRELWWTEVVEHRCPPQAQRLREQSGGALRFTETQCLLSKPQQMLELRGINLVAT